MNDKIYFCRINPPNTTFTFLYYIKIYISTENNPFQTFLSFSMKVTGFMKIFNFTLLCEKFLYECISWFFKIYFLGLNKIFEEFLIETFRLELYI